MSDGGNDNEQDRQGLCHHGATRLMEIIQNCAQEISEKEASG